MSIKPLFVTGIENLTLKATPGRGDAVSNVFWITADRSFVDRLIPNEAREAIGGIELASLTSGRPVAYSKGLAHSFSSELEAHRSLVNWLRLITVFLQHVWLIVDNAAGLEFGYVIWPTGGQIMTTRNFLGLLFTEADMTSGAKHLGMDDFRRLRELFQKNIVDSAVAKKTKKASRLDRAIYFVQSARAAPHLPVKIANYCTALEALFSNDTTELTHKLSERVGCFIGSNGTERLDMFQRVKKAYGIRSRVVHGVADWSADIKLGTETSRFLDDVLRQVLRVISSSAELSSLFTADSESGKRKHEEFLLGLVLGTSFIPKP